MGNTNVYGTLPSAPYSLLFDLMSHSSKLADEGSQSIMMRDDHRSYSIHIYSNTACAYAHLSIAHVYRRKNLTSWLWMSPKRKEWVVLPNCPTRLWCSLGSKRTFSSECNAKIGGDHVISSLLTLTLCFCDSASMLCDTALRPVMQNLNLKYFSIGSIRFK